MRSKLDEDREFAGGAYGLETSTHDAEFSARGGSDLPAPRSGPRLSASPSTFLSARRMTAARSPASSELKLKAPPRPRAQVGIEMVSIFSLRTSLTAISSFAREIRATWAVLQLASQLASPPLRVVDEWQTVRDPLHAPGPTQFWISPIETVSESEDGFERVYQGIADSGGAGACSLARGRLGSAGLAAGAAETALDRTSRNPLQDQQHLARRAIPGRPTATLQRKPCAWPSPWLLLCDICGSFPSRSFRLFQRTLHASRRESPRAGAVASRRCISMRRSACVVASQVAEWLQVEFARPVRD